MAKHLLFYESAVPVSVTQHRDLAIEPVKYGFAATVNAVPLTCVEFPLAAREYTVVFAGENEVVPVALLGIKDAENLYVNDEGDWSADYVPAFVRRYPFVFSTGANPSQLTLCVDEKWGGCNRENRGQRLFDDQGERTPYLNQMLKFLEEFQVHFTRTQTFCKKLLELDLLEPMKADISFPDGGTRSLVGFRAVSRAKLKALSAEKLAELCKSDELELIYDHLLSMNNFSLIINRVSQRQKTSSDAPAAEEAAAEAPQA